MFHVKCFILKLKIIENKNKNYNNAYSISENSHINYSHVFSEVRKY